MKNNNSGPLQSECQQVIQEWLDANGLTRRTLGKWLGFDPSLLTHIINRKRNATARVRAGLESVGFPLDALPEPIPRRKRGRKKGGGGQVTTKI